VRVVPRLYEFYPVICLTTEEKGRKNLSQGKKNLSQVNKNLSQCTNECILRILEAPLNGKAIPLQA